MPGKPEEAAMDNSMMHGRNRFAESAVKRDAGMQKVYKLMDKGLQVAIQ